MRKLNNNPYTAIVVTMLFFVTALLVVASGVNRVHAQEHCPGDIDNDATVDGSDLAALASDFGSSDCAALPPCIPDGGIIMWSGAIEEIPDGWLLCDGQNGTPDLRDRFIVGAGNEYTENDTGGEANTHLDITNVPYHAHELDPNGAVDYGQSVDIIQRKQLMHQHYYEHNVGDNLLISDNWLTPGGFLYKFVYNSDEALDHTNKRTSSPFLSDDYLGFTEEFRYDDLFIRSWLNGANLNDERCEGEPFDNRPPYYALAFIIKVAQ